MNLEADRVAEEISSWRSGRSPDALRFLSVNPSIASDKSLVLDLAYAEYCMRIEAGERIAPGTFCNRFSRFQVSLARLIEVHEYLANGSAFSQIAAKIDWPRAGQEFCGFQLLRELGRGAFSRVFVAAEPALGDRQVVVKLTWAGPGEAKTLGRLSHANVVPVYSVRQDSESGLTVVCMPFLGEATLSDLVDAVVASGRLPVYDDILVATVQSQKEGTTAPVSRSALQIRARRRKYVDAVVDLALQLAEALAFTHRLGVLHGDLKPSNVLLTSDGRPMLLDFNLSRDFTSNQSRAGGTLPYMAPEQIMATFFSEEAAQGAIDQRADIYSFGAVLYQLLTGSPPFFEERGDVRGMQTALEVLERQAGGAKPISNKNSAVDPKLDLLICRCLDPKPANRPETAQEIVTSLQYLRSRRYRVVRWAKAHRRTIGIFLLAATVGAASAGVWLAMRPPYFQRAYQSGLANYDQGNFQEALAEFDAAKTAAPASVQVLFARGMASVRLNDFENAISDFRQANSVGDRGAIDAMLGYCFSILSLQQIAVHYSQEAINSGFSDSAVLNNLGYSLCELQQFAEAREALDQAIAGDSLFFEAYHNRALVEFKQALAQGSKLDSARSDIQVALNGMPQNPEIVYDAACIFAMSSKTHPEHKSVSIEYLRRAVELGAATNASSSFFAHLRGDPRFEECARKSSTQATSKRQPSVVLPFTSARLQ